MKQTRKILLSVYWGFLSCAILILLLFETGVLESGTATVNSQAEFIMEVVMELMPLTGIWLALRLFKMKQVKQDLTSRKAVALRKWGFLRIYLLDIPLVANTLFYELFLKTTFGYLAIILLICQPFVYPSLSRCEAEVETENIDEHEEANNSHSQL